MAKESAFMKLLTTAQAAAYANKSETTIIRWCKAGHVKFARHGLAQSFMIYPKSLDKYLNEKKRTPHGFVVFQTAVNMSGVPGTTIRKMIKRGDLESKKAKNRVYVKKADLKKLDGYDPQEARVQNGKRTAAMLGQKREEQSQPTYPPATPRQIEHDALLAWMEDIRRR